MIKKKEGMSDADFIKHYNHVHAQMAAPVLEKHGVITYSLTYHLQRDRTILQDMLHDYKCFAKFMYDPDSKALTTDHDNFMVESQMKMMVGDEYMVIEDGKR
ncbi:hypothetical protein LTR60_006328, partial [Cryomyces antarcticus]